MCGCKNKCVAFWLDNPCEAFLNIDTIVPHQGQCLDEKLNGISLFVVIFSLFLAAMNKSWFWIFGLVGLFMVILYKYIFNQEYKFFKRRGPQKYYDSLETNQFYEEDLNYFFPALNNVGEDFDTIKRNVADQIVNSRFPGYELGCSKDFLDY